MSVNKFIDGKLRMVAGLTPGGGGTGSIIKIQLSSTKGNTISNVGITLNIKNEEYSSTTDNDGVAIFNGVTEVGTMTVTAAAEEFPSQTFKIEFFGSYELIMVDSDPYEDWLVAAGLNPASYEDIDELLEDEVAVRTLMTKTAAVDILANHITGERLEKIINHRYAAKWINYREYAYSTLSANEIIKELMDASGMYGMYITAKSKSRPLVPVLTSDTGSDGGKVSASSYYEDYYAWRAFDNNVASDTAHTCWISNSGSTAQWLGYQFTKPTSINGVKLEVLRTSNGTRLKDFIIQASNDGTEWTDLIETITFPQGISNGETFVTKEFDVTDSNYYTYYRIYMPTGSGDTVNPNWLNIRTLQFYGYQLEGLIPTMTSNTSPEGECFATNVNDTNDIYKSFNNNNEDAPIGKNDAEIFTIGYKFNKEVVVNRVYFIRRTNDARSYIVQGSNNGSIWNDIYSFSVSSGTEVTKEFSNTTPYQYIRVQGSVGNYAHFMTLQFYDITKEPTLWEPKGLVPVMTSNTAPYGEVSASTTYGTDSAYKAFDNNDDTYWMSANNAITNQYIGYMFTNLVCVRSFKIKNYNNAKCLPYNYTVEAYNGNEWIPITDKIAGDRTADKVCTYYFENNNYYIGYRLLMDEIGGAVNVALFSLQFYGRQLEALIPPMTSNTTPIGEAISSGIVNKMEEYYALTDAYPSYFWQSDKDTNCWLGYKSENPFVVKEVAVTSAYINGSVRVKDFVIQGSNTNDSSDWHDIYTGTYQSISTSTTGVTQHFSFENQTPYLYHRIFVKNYYATGESIIINRLQFYGAPDYESRTYIYDHGVELMELTTNVSAVLNMEDSQFVVSGAGAAFPVNLGNIDATPYKIMCMNVGDRVTFAANSMAFGVNNSTNSERLAIYAFVGGEYWVTVDVSNINANVTAFVSGTASTSMSVASWWLE